MCGLVGCVGKIFNKEETAFKNLLMLDTMRGHHSTGMMSVTKDIGKWTYFKEVGTAWDLMGYDTFDKIMRRSHAVLFGHNRMATKGKIIQQNAHPFDHSHIIGAHNGTLDTQIGLKDHEMFDVDSDNIIYNIAEEGAEETLKKLRGAFALVWYDAHQHTMNMVRNDKRPLWYTYSKDRRTLFWASEGWMLHIALGRAGIEFEEPKELAEKHLMVVEVPIVNGSDVKELTVDVQEIEFAPPIVVISSINWYDNHRSGGYRPHEHHEKNQAALTQGETRTQTPATGTNLVPIRTPGPSNVISSMETHKIKKLLQAYSGKLLTFSVVGHKKIGSQEFIVCDLEDDVNNPEIRIFTKETSSLGKLLMKSTYIFTGKCNGFSHGDCGNYLRLDHRTIMEAPLPEDKVIEQSVQDYADATKNMVFPLYGGRVGSIEDFYSLTANGCAECGEYGSPKERHDILWVSEKDYFCPKCRNSQMAAIWQNYVSN